MENVFSTCLCLSCHSLKPHEDLGGCCGPPEGHSITAPQLGKEGHAIAATQLREFLPALERIPILRLYSSCDATPKRDCVYCRTLPKAL